TIVVLNMMDEVEESGVMIDVEALERELGTPVVPMAAARKQGLEDLREAIRRDVQPAAPLPWKLMPAVQGVVDELESELADRRNGMSQRARREEVLRVLASEEAL